MGGLSDVPSDAKGGSHAGTKPAGRAHKGDEISGEDQISGPATLPQSSGRLHSRRRAATEIPNAAGPDGKQKRSAQLSLPPRPPTCNAQHLMPAMKTVIDEISGGSSAACRKAHLQSSEL